MRKFKVHRDALGGMEQSASEAGSEGLRTAELVSLADGSTHVDTSVCRLESGGSIGGHLHPFEESFYVLSGEVIVSIDQTAHHLVTDDFGFAPVSAPHAWFNPFDRPAVWYRIRSPQPRPVGEFHGTYPVAGYPAPTRGRPVRELHPRSRYVGHFDLSGMSPPGPLMMPGTHGHNIRSVSVRMMVDDVLGAIHHQTFMVEFEPAEGDTFSGSPHYHDFEEAYFVSGQAETELEGERFEMEVGSRLACARDDARMAGARRRASPLHRADGTTAALYEPAVLRGHVESTCRLRISRNSRTASVDQADGGGAPPQCPKASSNHHEAWLVTLASINSGRDRSPWSHRATGSRSATPRTVTPSKPKPRAIEAMSVGGNSTMARSCPSGPK